MGLNRRKQKIMMPSQLPHGMPVSEWLQQLFTGRPIHQLMPSSLQFPIGASLNKIRSLHQNK